MIYVSYQREENSDEKSTECHFSSNPQSNGSHWRRSTDSIIFMDDDMTLENVDVDQKRDNMNDDLIWFDFLFCTI